MKLPWKTAKAEEQTALLRPDSSKEIIEIHRTHLCSEMSRLLLGLEVLKNGRIDSENGYISKYQLREAAPKIEGAVVCLSKTGQILTLHAETNGDSKKATLAIDKGFPLEVIYSHHYDGEEEIAMRMEGVTIETNEELALRAIDIFRHFLLFEPNDSAVPDSFNQAAIEEQTVAEPEAQKPGTRVLRLVS